MSYSASTFLSQQPFAIKHLLGLPAMSFWYLHFVFHSFCVDHANSCIFKTWLVHTCQIYFLCLKFHSLRNFQSNYAFWISSTVDISILKFHHQFGIMCFLLFFDLEEKGGLPSQHIIIFVFVDSANAWNHFEGALTFKVWGFVILSIPNFWPTQHSIHSYSKPKSRKKCHL